MKSKVLLATCVMSLAVILGGCGSDDISTTDSKYDVAVPTDSANIDTPAATEAVEPTKAPEAEVTNAPETEPTKAPEATEPTKAPEAQPTKAPEAQPTKAPVDVKADAEAAYKAILKDAQAIAVELREPMNSLTFNYDDNVKGYGKHIEDYAIVDINKDGVPEMIARTMINVKWNIVNIYTYVDGKAVRITNAAEPLAGVTISQNASADGSYVTYICEDNQLHSVWKSSDGTMETNDAYVIVGTKLQVARCDKITSDKIVDIESIYQINKEY